MFHENNSSNFTLFIDLSDFELYQTKVVNVESMVAEENVQSVDDFIDDNEVQYDGTLEDYMDDQEDFEYESNDETSECQIEICILIVMAQIYSCIIKNVNLLMK